jgi:hypothetical protein
MSGELFPEILAECDRHLAKGDVGDWLFPSSNEYGIPDLLQSLQPRGLELPVNRIGAIARKTRVEGQTLHGYCDDYRINGLWKDPSWLVNSGCKALAAPNFSTNGEMPKAIVLAYQYAKMWILRWAQSYGIEAWVDLAMNDHYYEIAYLGVPRGWKAYSTFIYTRDYSFRELEDQFSMACDHAGTDEILFWCYGGEHDTQAKCQARGWLWTPAHQQAYLRNIGGTKQRQPKLPKSVSNGRLGKQIEACIEEPKVATLQDWC